MGAEALGTEAVALPRLFWLVTLHDNNEVLVQTMETLRTPGIPLISFIERREVLQRAMIVQIRP